MSTPDQPGGQPDGPPPFPPPPGAEQFPPPQQFPPAGTPPQFSQGVPPYPAGGAPPATSNGLATAALVVGLIGLLCLGFLAGIPAVILGYLGLQKSKEIGDIGKGQAIAGIILGAVAIAWSVLWVVIIVASRGSISNA